MQYHTIPCNTMQNHAIPYSTMHYRAIPCNTKQYHAIPCNNMQYNATPCNTMQYHTTQYYAIQCNTMQYHAIPCIINNCWRSVPMPCGQYNGHFYRICYLIIHRSVTVYSLWAPVCLCLSPQVRVKKNIIWRVLWISSRRVFSHIDV